MVHAQLFGLADLLLGTGGVAQRREDAPQQQLRVGIQAVLLQQVAGLDHRGSDAAFVQVLQRLVHAAGFLPRTRRQQQDQAAQQRRLEGV